MAGTDKYGNPPSAYMVGPVTQGFAITPSDANDLTNVTRAIYVGGAGNINVMWQDGTTTLFTAVPVGSFLNIRAARVLATNTTATNLLGLY